jgi:RNA-directed DNA polymerase
MSESKQFSISKKLIWEAYERVKSNKGAAGIDDQAIADFEKDLKKNLYKIWNRMSSGAYFPPAVKAVGIPKKDGGVRLLGIPTVSDRIAQSVVKMVLEPVVDPKFHPDSFGYRPKKSALQAVALAKQRCFDHFWVIDLDIKGFFDNIDHDLMMKAVRHHTDCKWVLLYIERWLKAPLMREDGALVQRERGTPQGGVVSPLLANLFLHHAFDEWMRRNHPEMPFERYADDIVVHCKTMGQANQLRRAIGNRMMECKLELHPEKTKIVFCRKDGRVGWGHPENFDFLGFTFRQRTARNKQGQLFNCFLPAISDDSRKKISQTVRAWRINLRSEKSLDELSEMFNPVIRGWCNYYGKFYHSELSPIYNQINEYLARWYMRKYKPARRHRRRARHWVRAVSKRNPKLFAHWMMSKPDAHRTGGAV